MQIIFSLSCQDNSWQLPGVHIDTGDAAGAIIGEGCDVLKVVAGFFSGECGSLAEVLK